SRLVVSRAANELSRLTQRQYITFAEAVSAGTAASLKAAVEAIYLHLEHAQHLRYEFERAFDVVSGEQRVRLPLQVGQQNRGTCLDLALLFASCLANAKLWPIVVVVGGHALAATWVTTPAPSRKTFIPLDELRGHVDGGQIVAVECTGFVEGFPGRSHKLRFA